MESRRVVVLGASGGIGSAVVRELHERGHEVVAVNRRGDAAAPEGVARRAGDLEDAISTMAATDGADVIVMAAQPPYGGWHGPFERMIEHTLAAAEAHGARLVMADNLYMYGRVDGPITEDTPERATTPSNVLRREIGRTLLAAHEAGRVRVTIGRLSDYYGPHGSNSAITELGLLPALAGKPMRTVMRADVPHTFHFLPDAARDLRVLVEDERADGRPWILPAAPAITQGDILAIVNRCLPAPVPIRHIGPLTMRVGALFVREARGMLQVAHQFDRPWVVDASQFESTFGAVETTPHESAVAQTVAWFSNDAAAAPVRDAVAV